MQHESEIWCGEAEGGRRAYLQIMDAVLGNSWSHNQTQPHRISENELVNYYAEPCMYQGCPG